MAYRSLPVVKKALDPVCASIPDNTIGIHGKLYDITNFDHPGGASFVRLALGTDATALFETHHLDSQRAMSALKTLAIVGSYTPTVKYDYSDYAGIREIAHAIFPTRESRRMQPKWRRWLYATVTFTFGLHVLSLFMTVGTLKWMCVCVCAAYMNTVCGGYGHNALHRLEFSALLLDWNGLSCYEWMFEHIQSHHMYVNTDNDHDSISMEPFIQWIPHRRHNWFSVYAPYAKHILYAIAEIVVSIQGNFIHRTRWKALSNSQLPVWLRLAPFLFVARIGSYFLAQGVAGLATALTTLCVAGYFFAYLAHLNHAFDANEHPNFLRHQLKNTKDIGTIVKGSALLFLDRQTLHHSFPTIDHTQLTRDVRDILQFDHFMKEHTLSALHAQVNRSFERIRQEAELVKPDRRRLALKETCVRSATLQFLIVKFFAKTRFENVKRWE